MPVVETRSTGVIGTGDGHIVFERLGLVDQHVGTPGGEALVVGHVVARHALADLAGYRHGLGGIAHVLVEAARRQRHREAELALGAEMQRAAQRHFWAARRRT